MKNIILIILSTVFCLPAIAQSGDVPPQPQNTPTAKLEMRQGAAHYIFKDGREAALYVNYGLKKDSFIGLKQIENTCFPQQKLAFCKLNFDMIANEISVRWTKHPDAQKIGQPLKVDNNILLYSGSPIFRYDQIPQLQAQFQQETLSCDNFDWFDNIPSHKGVTQIESWASEVMIANDETQLNENQALSTQHGMKFQKTAATSAKMLDYGRRSGLSFGEPGFLIGQVINVGYLSETQQACQVAFEGDFSSALKILQDPNFKTFDDSKRQLLTHRLSTSNLISASSFLALLVQAYGYNPKIE